MKIVRYFFQLLFLFFLLVSSESGAQTVPNFNINPANLTGGLINTLTPSFTWDDVSGETGYFFTVTRTSDNIVVYQNTTLAANTINITITTGGGTGWIAPYVSLELGIQYRYTISTNPAGSSSDLTYTLMSLPAKPTLSDPADGATNQSVIKIFDWSDGAAGETFTFQIDNNGEGFASPHENINGLAVSNHQVTPVLDYAAPYQWRVRGTNVMGDGPWSDVFTFSTRLSPTAALLLSPANGITGVSIIPSFSWEDVGAANYRISIDDNDDFLSPVYQNDLGAVTSKNFNASELRLNNNTRYNWRIFADEFPSLSQHFTTVPAMVPIFDQPFNGATTFAAATKFTWHLNQPIGGLTFILQYKQSTSAPVDESFWNDAVNRQTTSLFSDEALVLGKTYYWRVLVRKTTPAVVPYDYIYYPAFNVYNTFSVSSGSAVDLFPAWPKDGTTLYTNSPMLKWYINEYASGLVFQVAYGTTDDTDADGELTDEVGTQSYPTNANVLTVSLSDFYWTVAPALTPGTHYYWQVRFYYFPSDADGNPAAGNDGYSDWSPIEDFYTQGPGTVIQPNVAYPCNNILVYTTAPRLKWYLNEPTSAITYRVDVCTDAAMLNHVAGFPALTLVDQLFYDCPALEAGETYYWRVQSTNGITNSDWSEATPVVHGAFTIQESSSSFAQPSYPLFVTDLIWTARPTLSWYLLGSSVGLDGYVVKWRKDAPPADWATYNDVGFFDVLGDINTTSYTIPVDMEYGGHYYWAVACFDGFVFSTWHQAEFTIVGGTTMVDIQLDQPIDASIIFGTTVNLKWYLVGPAVGIDHYDVEYSYSDVYTPGTIEHPTANNLTVNNLVLGATYWWRVKGVYASGDDATPWTTRYRFTVMPGATAIVQPQIGGPDNIDINTTSPVLSWYNPVKSDLSSAYEVEISDNLNFSNSQVLSTSDSKIQVSDLKSGNEYYWRVRAKDNADKFSSYSGIGEFSISTVTDVKEEVEIPAQFNLQQNYPNPFNPSTVIKFGIPENGFVTLKVFDILGREIKTLLNEEKNPGYYSVQWNGLDNFGSPVSAGIYLYRITSGSNSLVQKMMLLK